jgi:hypothetical protein
MMANNTIKFKWNHQALAEIERKTLLGIMSMAQDIRSQARMNAPYVTGALSNSIRVEEDGYTTYIKAGGIVAVGTLGPKKVDYAMKREEGPNRDPATEHYMRNAMNSIMTGDYMQKYFGEITK